MKNIFLIGGLISLTYLILKIVEMKIFEKEKKMTRGVLLNDSMIFTFKLLICFHFVVLDDCICSSFKLMM